MVVVTTSWMTFRQVLRLTFKSKWVKKTDKVTLHVAYITLMAFQLSVYFRF